MIWWGIGVASWTVASVLDCVRVIFNGVGLPHGWATKDGNYIGDLTILSILSQYFLRICDITWIKCPCGVFLRVLIGRSPLCEGQASEL